MQFLKCVLEDLQDLNVKRLRVNLLNFLKRLQSIRLFLLLRREFLLLLRMNFLILRTNMVMKDVLILI